MLIEAQNLNINSKVVSKKGKFLARQCFPIQNFAYMYNAQETRLIDGSCYFVIYQQFLD